MAISLRQHETPKFELSSLSGMFCLNSHMNRTWCFWPKAVFTDSFLNPFCWYLCLEFFCTASHRFLVEDENQPTSYFLPPPCLGVQMTNVSVDVLKNLRFFSLHEIWGLHLIMCLRVMFIYVVSEALPDPSCTIALFVLFANLKYEISDKMKMAEATVTRDFLVHWSRIELAHLTTVLCVGSSHPTDCPSHLWFFS